MKQILTLLFLLAILSQALCRYSECQSLDINPKKLQIHETFVKQIKYSPDDKYIVTSSGDQTAKLINSENHNVEQSYEHPAFVLTGSVSYNGKYLVTGCWDKKIRVFDIEKQELIIEINEAHSDWISQTEFSKDNKFILSGGADQLIKIWEVETGKLVKEVNIGGQPNDIIFHTTYSKDGSKIIASLNSGKIKTLDVNEDYDIEVYSRKRGGDITATSAKFFGENNKYIVSTSWDQNIYFWQTESNQTLGIMQAFHDLAISNVDVTNDETLMLTASEDETVKLWDLKGIITQLEIDNTEINYSDYLIHTFKEFEKYVWNAHFTNTRNNQFVAGGEDGNVYVLELSKILECYKSKQQQRKVEDL